jgi:hypothetical protein
VISAGYNRAMIPDRDTYDEAEWAASAGHGPPQASRPGEAFLIYRHWIWANLQKISFEQSFESKEMFDPPEMAMVGRGPIFMFVWYGLLWSVIESIEERKFDLYGPLRDDIAHMRDALKRCRNALMHVPSSNNLLDPRIQKLIELPRTSPTNPSHSQRAWQVVARGSTAPKRTVRAPCHVVRLRPRLNF